MQNFSERLRKAIKASGLKQREICDLAGIKQPYLSQILNGKTSLQNIDLKKKLAQITGVDMRWLIDGDEQYHLHEDETEYGESGERNKSNSPLNIMTQAYAILIPKLDDNDLVWLVEQVEKQPDQFAPILPTLLAEIKKRIVK